MPEARITEKVKSSLTMTPGCMTAHPAWDMSNPKAPVVIPGVVELKYRRKGSPTRSRRVNTGTFGRILERIGNGTAKRAGILAGEYSEPGGPEGWLFQVRRTTRPIRRPDDIDTDPDCNFYRIAIKPELRDGEPPIPPHANNISGSIVVSWMELVDFAEEVVGMGKRLADPARNYSDGGNDYMTMKMEKVVGGDGPVLLRDVETGDVYTKVEPEK